MIEPVKLSTNVQFKGDLDNAVNQNTAQEIKSDVKLEQSPEKDVVELKDTTQDSEKTSLKEKFSNFKKTTTGIVKNFNTVTGTTNGVVRGITDFALVGGLVGLFGKNIKNAKGDILGTIKGVGADCLHGIGKAVKSLPKVWTQAPKDNIKGILSLPSKFYGQYLKGHKVTAAAATVLGIGALAFRTIQGKMAANMKNADVDHATKLGHV